MYHYWGTSVSIFSTINKRRVAIRMPLCAFSKKKKLAAVGDGGRLIPESRVCMLIPGDGASLFQSREYYCWKLTKKTINDQNLLHCSHVNNTSREIQVFFRWNLPSVKLFRDPFLQVVVRKTLISQFVALSEDSAAL